MHKTKKLRTSRIRKADPFFERESQKYDNPLPSREYIEQILGDVGHPMDIDSLFAALDIRDEEREHFARRLRAMERDGQLMRNRRGDYIIPDKAALIRGRVEGHPDGYGFLVPDDGSDDIFLGPKSMREVMHGDRVLVRVAGLDHRGRREGRIVEVLERGNTRVVGRIIEQQGVTYLAPENRRINHDILLAPMPNRSKPKAGDVVTVELVQQPGANAQPIGRIVERIGSYADPGMEIEIALRKHDLPFEFSAETKAEARKLPSVVRKKDLAGREDIRHLPLVTIDGETAKDFDDAVYCERVGKGYRLVVAIADVSHYVEPGSALDADALARGNSVYFPRRVIPMLPEKLSNGLCSLNPEVDRLCMVCDMDIGPTGAIRKYRFYPAVMFSHARLTYTQVAAALYDKDADAIARLGALLPHVESLDALFRVLLQARAKRGAIDFETIETRMIFNDEGKIERIVPEARNDAHRLIEECMLAANVCASDFLHKNKHPALYRVHEGPTPEKLEKLRAFLAEFGLGLGGGDSPKASDYAKVIERIKTRPDFPLIQTVMLRSLQQAVYSPENVGHFGLAYEAYTHFTSPIRRYPDLLVHRAIKAVLNHTKYQPASGPVELLQDTRRKKGKQQEPDVPGRARKDAAKAARRNIWDDIGMHCSMTERRADEASRDVESWLKCYYMQDHVGEEYAGSITAVVPFGIFVTLDELFVEGLVHISDLGRDYFHYEESRHELVGERSGQRFRLSDRVDVQIVRVDLETRKIDFRLIEAEMPSTRREGKTARDAGRKQAAAVNGSDDEVVSWRKLAGLPDTPDLDTAVERAARNARSKGKAAAAGKAPAPAAKKVAAKKPTARKPAAKATRTMNKKTSSKRSSRG
ncbi:ribonuclease R [Uliginosibacterium sp. sgz301328]|uniref:ribonuclease R n=1 Tax=Uliginosibacterium sp. sgz301328 TaxID=3243764 RepID=UPI00359CFCA3